MGLRPSFILTVVTTMMALTHALPTAIRFQRQVLSTLLHSSSYHQSIGLKHSACSRCQGLGEVKAKKKNRPRRFLENTPEKYDGLLRSQLDPMHHFQRAPRVPCPACEGCGLVRTPDSSDSAASPVASSDAVSTDKPGNRKCAVAIVGGGLGGLALALALQQRGISCAVLEKDARADQRAQGYGLTLQQGAKAARALGILDACRAASALSEPVEGTTSEAALLHKSYRSDGQLLGTHGGGTPRNGTARAAHLQNLILSRQNLRQILLEHLAPGTVEWNTVVESVNLVEQSPAEPGAECLRLHLNGKLNGSFLEVSALVGADGIRSSIRSLLDNLPVIAEMNVTSSSFPIDMNSNAGLEYLGMVVVLGIAPALSRDDEAHLKAGSLTEEVSTSLPPPSVNEAVDGENRVYYMPYSRSKSLPQSSELDLDMWQLSFPEPDEAAARKLAAEGPSGLLAAAKARCGAWQAPGVAELIHSTQSELVTGYPIYDRQTPWSPPELLRPSARPEWRHDAYSEASTEEANGGAKDSPSPAARVLSISTLIGDAAHPMAPFKGQGANQALLDAVCLARALYDSRLGDDTALFENARSSSRSRCSISSALGAFESEMQRRSAPKMSKSREASQLLHSPAALTLTNKRVTRAAAAAAAAAADTTDTRYLP